MRFVTSFQLLWHSCIDSYLLRFFCVFDYRSIIKLPFVSLFINVNFLLHLNLLMLTSFYLLTFCHHIVVLLLVPADGIPGSGLSSFAEK